MTGKQRVGALGARYGKRLALVESSDEHFVVNEVDEYGLVRAFWGSGDTEQEAIDRAESLLGTLREPVEDESVRGAYLGVARTLPSDVLKAVLLERGDWNIEVKS